MTQTGSSDSAGSKDLRAILLQVPLEDRLALMRKHLGLTRPQLAELLGYDKGYIAAIERKNSKVTEAFAYRCETRFGVVGSCFRQICEKAPRKRPLNQALSDCETPGARLRCLRTEFLGLTQRALSEQLGLTAEMVSRHENDHTPLSPRTRYRLENLFGVAPRFFCEHNFYRVKKKDLSDRQETTGRCKRSFQRGPPCSTINLRSTN